MTTLRGKNTSQRNNSPKWSMFHDIVKHDETVNFRFGEDGFEFELTNTGDLYKHDPLSGNVRILKGFLIDGKRRISLTSKGKRYTFALSNLEYFLFHGEEMFSSQVNHKVIFEYEEEAYTIAGELSILELCTTGENVEHGRFIRSNNLFGVEISAKDVKTLKSQGITTREQIKQYNLSNYGIHREVEVIQLEEAYRVTTFTRETETSLLIIIGSSDTFKAVANMYKGDYDYA